MARGSNTLFADIFEPEIILREKKGRSADLHALRNDCLIHRYFWYGSQRLSYPAILEAIGREFFISPQTVPYIVKEYVAQLKQLRDEKPSIGYFEKKWPHLKWHPTVKSPR